MDRRGFLYLVASASSFLGLKNTFANTKIDYLFSLEKKSQLPIGQWVEKYVDLWNNSPPQIPNFLPQKHHKSTQINNELRIKNYTRKLEKDGENPLRKGELLIEGRQIVGELFGVNIAGMNLMASSGLLAGFSQYLEIVRKRDPSITAEDIFQAGRNVATAMSLQYLSDQKMELSPAIYAYSILYPYTDNLLDDENLTKMEKLTFANRFGQRLAGEITTYSPNDAYERRIFPLVEYIEGQWPRDSYPGVYESLLAIHDMQVKSISQQKKLGSVSSEDIIRLSVEKGGASVLADAFLVTGTPDPQLAEFAFAYGVLLQLLDDLQDVKQDMANRSATLFTIKAHGWDVLDEQVWRLLNMAQRIFDQVDALRGVEKEQAPVVKQLLMAGIFHFVGEVVANNPHMFSEFAAHEVLSRVSITPSALREMNLEKTFLHKFRKEPEQTIKILKALS